MKIAIITPGGITNFGERAIMLGTVYKLREQYPDDQLVIFGYQDLETEDPAMFKDLSSMNVQFYPLLIHGKNKLIKLVRAVSIGVAPRLTLPKASYHYLKGAIVYSKGQESLTQNYGTVHFIDSFLEQLLVSRIADRVILYGHSVGPIHKFRRLARLVVKRFDMICVRDTQSKDTLLALGYPTKKIEVIKDLAYAAVEKYNDHVAEKQHYLIVPNAAICQTAELKERHLTNIRTIIRTLLRNKQPVVLGSSVSTKDWNNDYELCEKLKEDFPHVELRHYRQLRDFLKDVKEAKKVISARLHPLIMATGMKTEVLAMSRSPKVLGLLSDLAMESAIVDPFTELKQEELSSHL